MPSDPLLRPIHPLVSTPAGYSVLARYSSLGYLWRCLAGAQAAGRTLSVLRGDQQSTARRRIGGYHLHQAGVLLHWDHLEQQLQEDFSPHPAIIALLGGDREPLHTLLNQRSVLELEFVVALNAKRELLLRLDGSFRTAAAVLPQELKLRLRRLGRDEQQLLLLRACALA